MNLSYADRKFENVDEFEMGELHKYFRNIFVAAGLDNGSGGGGGALDHAIANCVRVAANAIEDDRAAKAARSKLQLV
jgi:hypothetical protein